MSGDAFTWMSDADKAKADAEINDTLRDAGLEHDAPPEEPPDLRVSEPRNTLLWALLSDAGRMDDIARMQKEASIRYGGEWGTPRRDSLRPWIHIKRGADGATVIVEETPFGEDPLSWPDEPTFPEIGLKP